ncbi:hypothetical protein MATR_01560 [Marivirga tractuosa]|uniref:Glycosyltransferase 61 catalytic domain-containing protein n=1 Tax=Marivirga tractuosa (strain ATCC 23168 / DSM 4126 / NBRC 15989 / NCIMB 1408 / VKM B-1430 / H-43) TaxID=643867 RepID=E4TVV5_MARTH|nr:glycosyltransferase family 61 protein [Marivirga tractuosa]ADR22203.1 hypothetical protein Ftrac_2223 [Marivirga tractuosa DSM 4126]BDD13331.1 hypothetical protein MATR_01560 [Marivirga tractuosa]
MIKGLLIEFLVYLIDKKFTLKSINKYLYDWDYSFKETIYYNSSYTKDYNSENHNFDFSFLNKVFKLNHWVLFLPKATVFNETGVIVINGKVLCDTIYNSKGYIKKSGLIKPYFKSIIIKPKILSGIYFHLSGLFNYNFFHFLIEVLPKILDYMILRKKKPEIKLLINNRNPFIEQYLSLIGIQDSEIKYFQNNVMVQNLYYSNNKFVYEKLLDGYWNKHIYSKYYLRKMAEKFLLSNNPNLNISKIIYLSRADSNRVLINESEFMEHFNHFKIKKLVLSRMCISDQIFYFKNASLVIAIHGASLSNLIYSSNCKVIELFPKGRNSSTLYQLRQISQIGENNSHHLVEISNVDKNQNILINQDEILKVEKLMYGY